MQCTDGSVVFFFLFVCFCLAFDFAARANLQYDFEGAAARLSGRGVGYVSTGQPVWYYLRLWGYWMSGTILGFGNPRCPVVA